jgi:hypothetical protein
MLCEARTCGHLGRDRPDINRCAVFGHLGGQSGISSFPASLTSSASEPARIFFMILPR